MLITAPPLPGMALASALMPSAEPRLRVPSHYRRVWHEGRAGRTMPQRAAGPPTPARDADATERRLRPRPDALAPAALSTRGRGEWTYGFFELRARLPQGPGLLTRVALRPPGFRTPQDGEIDLLLQDGGDPTRVGARVHTAAGHGARALSGSARVPSACSRFHRYQLHWTPDAIEFAVDGFVFLRYARIDAGVRVWPFDGPHHLLVECQAAPGLASGRRPGAIEIDALQVHQPPLESIA